MLRKASHHAATTNYAISNGGMPYVELAVSMPLLARIEAEVWWLSPLALSRVTLFLAPSGNVISSFHCEEACRVSRASGRTLPGFFPQRSHSSNERTLLVRRRQNNGVSNRPSHGPKQWRRRRYEGVRLYVQPARLPNGSWYRMASAIAGLLGEALQALGAVNRQHLPESFQTSRYESK